MICPLMNDECTTDCMFFTPSVGDCCICHKMMTRERTPIIHPCRSSHKSDRVRAYPTWSDGSPVMVNQVAMSLRGPKRIARIDWDEDGYRLFDMRDYIIDEGRAGSDHPTRFGEPCLFWPPEDAGSDADCE